MSAQVGTSSLPERLRCEAYAVIKASALNPKRRHPCYMVEITLKCTHLMSRTPGMMVSVSSYYSKGIRWLAGGGNDRTEFGMRARFGR